MTTIIFSFNRAAQLHALLDSMETHLTIERHHRIVVLYNATTVEFMQAYNSLIQHFSTVEFICEQVQSTSLLTFRTAISFWKNSYDYFRYLRGRAHTNFRDILIRIVQEETSCVMFLTDDSLCIRPCVISLSLLQYIENNMPRAVFSLRHGREVDSPPATLIQSVLNNGEYLTYNVPSTKTSFNHWTYKFSVDGHIYSARIVEEYLTKVIFTHPSSLESFVNYALVRSGKTVASELMFFENPVLLGFEVNQVQSFTNNNHHNVSVELLNDTYRDGYRLQYKWDTEQSHTTFRPQLLAIDFVKDGSTIHFELQQPLSE